MEGWDLDKHLPLVGVFALVAYAIAGVGQMVGNTIFPRGVPLVADGLQGWRYWFVRTITVHPIIFGMMIGYSCPLPIPEFLGPSIQARVLCFACAGIASMPIFDAIMVRLENLDGEPGPRRKP